MVATTVVLLMKEEKRATRDPILKIRILSIAVRSQYSMTLKILIYSFVEAVMVINRKMVRMEVFPKPSIN